MPQSTMPDIQALLGNVLVAHPPAWHMRVVLRREPWQVPGTFAYGSSCSDGHGNAGVKYREAMLGAGGVQDLEVWIRI
jgi:hypothetical protein